MKNAHDLSRLEWKLIGFTPHAWRFAQTMEIGIEPTPEVPAVPAKVPGSVQRNLREAKIIPDWRQGLNARACEWVENRHWIFETDLPDNWFQNQSQAHRLCCNGLDGNGHVLVNNTIVGSFDNSFLPHSFDLSPHIKESDN